MDGTHSENAADMSSSTTSQTDPVQASSSGSGPHTRGAIFILHTLPFHPQDDDAPAVLEEPYIRYSIKNLAATYISPLEEILSSSLNAAGFVRAICVNFGPMGYYELNPNANPITQPAAFEAQLRELFRNGVISNPDNNEVIWRIIPDLPSLMSELPRNSRKIGCLHGAGSEESTYFRSYIKTAPDDQIYVLVFGETDNQGIQTYIDDYMQVCENDLNASNCLSRVILEMEAKWGIY